MFGEPEEWTVQKTSYWIFTFHSIFLTGHLLFSPLLILCCLSIHKCLFIFREKAFNYTAVSFLPANLWPQSFISILKRHYTGQGNSIASQASSPFPSCLQGLLQPTHYVNAPFLLITFNAFIHLFYINYISVMSWDYRLLLFLGQQCTESFVFCLFIYKNLILSTVSLILKSFFN